MDYALIASGCMTILTASMVDVAPYFIAFLFFRIAPIIAGLIPIIAGVQGLAATAL